MKTCRRCGESKPPAEFYGDRSTADGLRWCCKACSQIMVRDYKRAHYWKRLCAKCGEKRPQADFYHWKDGGRPRVSRLCKACARDRQRTRYARIMADPYTAKHERDRKRSWDAEKAKKEANPERTRRYREKLKKERPDVYQQQLQDARIRNALRRERMTGELRVTTKRTPLPQQPRVYVAVGPLLTFVERVGFVPDGRPDVARALFRATHENAGYVTIETADALITAAGGTLALVYPEAVAA